MMKKILLTTTALIATAGIAAAEVSISGSAEMGISKSSKGGSLALHQDIDVTFSLSGETDGGLSFSAAIDIDEAGGTSCTTASTSTSVTALDTATPPAAATAGSQPTITSTTTCGGANGTTGGQTHGGVAVSIGGGFGNLTLGDTDGGADWALVAGGDIVPGSITDNSTTLDGYNASALDGKYGGQVLRYDNTLGSVGFAVSVERPADTKAANAGRMGYAAGVNFDAGVVTVGVAMQQAQTVVASVKTAHTLAGVSVSGDFSGLSYAVLYTTGKAGTAKSKQAQIGLAYSANEFSVGAVGYKSTEGTTKKSGIGFGASYDLGGGAKVLFGANTESEYSVGLSLAF